MGSIHILLQEKITLVSAQVQSSVPVQCVKVTLKMSLKRVKGEETVIY